MYELLMILAAIANVGSFLFQLMQEVRLHRSVKEDKKRRD